jgi:hypothetical protein
MHVFSQREQFSDWKDGEGVARWGRAAWSSSCSRNAHDKYVLVRRAQSRINQATLLTP